MARLQLHKIAHGRAGDKGNRSNIGLIPYRDEDYDLLSEHVTEKAVKDYFGHIVKGNVKRFDLPSLKAFNFILDIPLCFAVYLGLYNRQRSTNDNI